ncbi:MAG TPA: ABC transporter permease [Clostridia bacterium]
MERLKLRGLNVLIKRNIKCYLREKSNIFYSLLTVIIVVGLYILFMSKLYTDDIIKNLEPLGATNFQWLADSIMLSGLIPILSISVSLVVLGIIVTDKEDKIIMDFMVAPIDRSVWMLSYFISSLIICAVASFGMVFLTDLYLFIISGYALSFMQLIKILGITLLSLIFGNIFMIFLISFVKTSNGVGGIGTIIGTLQGFVSGCYMPFGVMPQWINYALYSLPFAQMSSLIREVYLENAQTVMNLNSQSMMFLEGWKEFYGVTMKFNDWTMPYWLMVVNILAFTIIFGVISAYRFIKMKNK